MSNVFRAFPALKAMAGNVRDYIMGQLSSTGEETAYLAPLFDNWMHPELAGKENTLLGPLVLEGGFGYKKSNTTLYDLCHDSDNPLDCTLHPVLYEMLRSKHLASSERTIETRRKPYEHQLQAYRAAKNHQSLIVSAGTGSGKTECFFYPIISEILKESAEERQRRGIRAIILYPTNALIHSQEERLTEYLNTEANRQLSRPISFCLYNGALEQRSPESTFYRINNRQDLYNVDASADEYGTPDIVLTNFSMLEYMLLRKKDRDILSATSTTLKHIVLDEAHTYTGANATEMALQIRRMLLAMQSSNVNHRMPSVQYYATSATFAGNRDSLHHFASTLFFNSDDPQVIEGHRFAPEVPFDGPTDINVNEYRDRLLELNEADEIGSEGVALENVYDVFNFAETERSPEQLARFLWRIPEIRRIYEWLRQDGDEKSFRFEDLCSDVFEHPTNKDRSLIAILMDVASLALFSPVDDVDKVPLIPVRWHVAVRKFEGAFACTDPNCRFKQAGLPAHVGKIYSSWREECECGSIVLPLAFCKKCGSPVLICKNDGNIGTPSLKNVIGAFFDSDDADENQWRNSSIELLSFEGAPNNIIRGTTLYSVDNDSQCPHCGYSEGGRKKFCQTLIHNKPLFTSLILEGLWPELPVAGSAENMWPSCGRHIISFSDTRQNAAQLAPTMENTFLRNTAYQVIYRILGGISQQYQELTLEEILERIGDANDVEPSEIVRLAGLANCDPKTKRERIAQLKLHVAYFLLNLPAGRYTPSLENAGIIECIYEGLDQCQYPRDILLFRTDDEYQDFLYMCLQSLRNRTSFDYQNSLKWLDKQFVDFFPYHNGYENVLSIYMEGLARKMGDVGTILNTDGNAPSVLEQVILESLEGQGIIVREGRTAKVKVGSMKFRIRQTTFWDCNETCRSVYKNIRGLSPFGNYTNGEGSEIREVASGTRFSRLWRTVNGEIYAFYAKEHSAQLKVKENKTNEALFKENLLNMLSCTTTMEMGIDVGALASVMLANTPPTPANYAQRAGRAGRRGEGATLIFTITSASPHDEMFYRKPDWAFVTSMLIPEVTLTNRTLVQRAVNAWLIRELCQDLLDQHNANNIFDAYSTYGLFFKSLREKNVLDWRNNQNSLLYKLINSPESPRCVLLRHQISDLLQGSGFEENWNLENNDSFVKTLVKSLSDLNDDIVRKINLIKEDSRQVQMRINELGVEKLDVEDPDEEKRIDFEIAKKQALLNSYTKEKNTLMNGSGNASEALKNSTISYLVDHQVFPSHGLPINVVSLDVMENKEGTQYPVLCEKFDLSRNREQAIRNFAPGNEVVVAGARYRSLGIRVDFRQRFGVTIPEDREDFISPIYICSKCKTIFNERQDHDCCPNCVDEDGNAIPLKSQKKIEPEAFVTNVGSFARKEGVKNPVHMPYKVITVVDGKSEDRDGNVFSSLKFIPSAHVHTYNSGYGEGFTYCKSCYAVYPWPISKTSGNEYSINRNFGAPNGSPLRCRDHHSFSKKENSFFLYSHYVTNAVEIHINDEFRNPLVSFDDSIRNTLGIALKIAITRTLEIEDKEINFALPTEHQIQDGCDLILYDTNVGGVGYIDRIASNNFDNLLTVAVRDILLGSEEHRQICHGACPQCLISYGTQFLFQNEASAPNRIRTLAALNVDRIVDNDIYDDFRNYLEQQDYTIKDTALIKNQIATADTLKIKLNSLSSDIFSSPLWESIRDRGGNTQIQLARAPQDDIENDIAKRMRGVFGIHSIVIANNDLPLGFYINDNIFFGLFSWTTMNAVDPLGASDDNPKTSWVEKQEHFEFGNVEVWQEPSQLKSHSHLWTESISKNKLSTLVKEIFDDLFGDGQIPNEIATAVSWIYEDEYALSPAPAGKKDVLKEIFAYLGIGHLLQNPANGLIRYLDRGNTYYEDIANIQCVPNARDTGELHDRRFRIKLADERWFILSMGKGLASFVTRNGKYVKLPGHLSWSIQDLTN
jgi:hypothetical protein